MLRPDRALRDLLAGGFEPPGRPHDHLGAGPAAEPHAEELGEGVGDLAMRHPGVLVEVGDGGLGVGAELAAGGAAGVAGLQGMAAAQALAAALAVAAVDAEGAEEGPARDLGLVLLIEVILDDRPAAGGTTFGQRGVADLLDLIGRRRGAMAMLAVPAAPLAPRLLGARLGFALGVGMNGYKYRAVFTNSAGSTTTLAATLTVEPGD